MQLSSDLAPIVLFCYNRLSHLQQTIEALKLNHLASKSRLIIFSDGFKKKKDEIQVRKVRNFIHTIDGFEQIEIIEAEKNKGLAPSIIEGVTKVIKVYKKVIVLEDDLISTPDFLTFMNNALSTYQFRQDIFSITGYAPPIKIPVNYSDDIYLAPRSSSWGWGTWDDRWQKADWELKDFKSSYTHFRNIIENGGEDLWPMLVKQQLGIINSWAVRWTLTQAINNALGVYPVYSKIKNIGTDGSGTNFTFKTQFYDSKLNEAEITIPQAIQLDSDVVKNFKQYYKVSLMLKIKNFLNYRI